MAKPVQTAIENGVASVTLNRPDVLNALNAEMAAALFETVSRLETDHTVRCVVITGAGGHFMAGGDIKFFRQWLDSDPNRDRKDFDELFDNVHGTIRVLRQMEKPVVASVRGAAAGFGVSLMAACDLSLVAENAVLTLAYCHLGASPDGGSTYYLPRMVGVKRAMELALLGEKFDAHRALEMGLATRVVAEAELERATSALAAHLSAGPVRAYANTKRLINASLHTEFNQQLDAEQESFIECAMTPDFAEGVTAFCEKRKPRFG